ncbi:class I adenylate-forming enzyme family protein [Halomicronema hongdechloris]
MKSETLAKGYCHASDAENRAFRNGYFFTGDLGKKDEAGYLYIQGRKRIFIDTGGYKVDPLEVETVLRQHHKVRDVVVVGKQHPHAGAVIKAVVVPQMDCESAELIDYCHQQMANFKVPKIIEFRDQIPRSPLGKILRKELI